MSNQEKIEIRDLRNGDWYWVHKAVIQKYAQKVGAIGIAVYNFLLRWPIATRFVFHPKGISPSILAIQGHT